MESELWRQRRREAQQRYLAKYPERRAASVARYNNKEETKKLRAEQYATDPTKYAAKSKAFYEKNKDSHKERCKVYYKEHYTRLLPYYAAACAKRRAIKKQATPLWGNKFFITEIYALAALRTKVTGFSWHVDHIIPLNSTLVCGLHVENNLRVIPGVENMSKGNKFAN